MKDFGIFLFGHTRDKYLNAVLESLRLQDALDYVEIWLDGHQGNPVLKNECEKVYQTVKQYEVSRILRHNGHLNFRKLIIHALESSIDRYRNILVLEDDCFPTSNAVAVFREQLEFIESSPEVFSVYGHPFLVEDEGEYIGRFQGWGWGTNTIKLSMILPRLKECFMMDEAKYLKFVEQSLTDDIVDAIDCTKGREATRTLKRFFSWDETLALLTAMEGMKHKKTPQRTIYNFGAGDDSGHFKKVAWYRQPPFNMISIEEVWDHF